MDPLPSASSTAGAAAGVATDAVPAMHKPEQANRAGIM